jgi:hypothetical protein
MPVPIEIPRDLPPQESKPDSEDARLQKSLEALVVRNPDFDRLEFLLKSSISSRSSS